MKRLLRIVFLIVGVLASGALSAQTAIGQWTDHFSYGSIHRVAETPTHIYAAAGMGLFSYSLDDHSVVRLNKTNRLNDAGIAAIAYDSVSDYLVVAYTNSNLDLVHKGNVFNLSDIKRSSIGGDKSVYGIKFYNSCAYLACGFGIVVVDLQRAEIKETYYLGENGGYLAVNDIAFTDNNIVAATSQGILIADKNQPFLNIASNWSLDTVSALWGQMVVQLESLGSHLLAVAYSFDPSQATLYAANADFNFQSLCEGEIEHIHPSSSGLAVVFSDYISCYNANLQPTGTYSEVSNIQMRAHDAMQASDGSLWVGHNWAGLLHVVLPDSVAIIKPAGPISDNVYRFVPYKDKMLVCPGGKRSTYDAMYLPANLYSFRNNKWSQLSQNDLLHSLSDIVDVAVNPKDTTEMLAASWLYGILQIKDNQPAALFTDTNLSGIIGSYSDGNFHVVRTGAVAFDKKGNAWMTNSMCDNNLVLRRKDGEWQGFNTRSMVAGGEIDKLLCDSVRGYIWFAGKANRIYVHSGDSLMAYVNPNNGSKLETGSVNCMVQDHRGDIWIGTNKGIKVIYNGYQAFKNGGHGEQSPVNCSNITMQSGDIYEYLMAYENITCMAVDGANRKWVGTASGGLYLISANGLEEVEHFTTSNSPLFSDKIIAVAVQPQTGHVFIGTAYGIQSYRGTATEAPTYIDKSQVHAFPNPVRPEYDGPIAIKGLPENALVHISSASGDVVFSATADGGQVVWQGKNNSGQKVGSGVYFVFASDETGRMRVVTKILMVR